MKFAHGFDAKTGEIASPESPGLCSFETLAAAFAYLGASSGAALVGAEAAAAGGGLAAASAGYTVAAPTAAAVGGGAAAAGGAAASGIFGTGVTALDVISGAASAFGSLASLRSGEIQAEGLTSQANLEDQRALIESARAEQEVAETRRRLLATVSQNRAAAAASGIDISSGSVQSGIRQATVQAGRSVSLARRGGSTRRMARASRAAQLRSDAASAKRLGAQRAAFGLLDTVDRYANRGSL